MRRADEDDYRAGSEDPRASFNLTGALDQLGRRLSGALMLAGGLIGLGLYMGSDGGQEAPEYQVYAADGEVFRLNLDSGSIIACNAQRCMQVLKPGEDLAEGQRNTLFTVPPATQAPAPQQVAPGAPPPAALPAPAAQPK